MSKNSFPSVASNGVLIISQCTSYVLRRGVSVRDMEVHTESCPMGTAVPKF